MDVLLEKVPINRMLINESVYMCNKGNVLYIDSCVDSSYIYFPGDLFIYFCT